MDKYLTLAKPAEGIYKEKMSKFLSFAVPVYSVDEAKEIVAQYQKKYYDARHVCWAYMIGTDRSVFYSNDNGEPSGTAGKPILGQINSFNLTNILIVVVRYFGGIKLGTSGLITAYKEAAKEAIEAGEIVERFEAAELTFSFGYLAMNEVMKVVKAMEPEIVSQQFDMTCTITIRIRKDSAPDFTARMEKAGATLAD